MILEIIIFPTDTVYGIGAKIEDTKSLDKIYQIKQRDKKKPISILFNNLSQMKDIVILNDRVQKLADFFWPGPLTLIVPTKIDFYNKTKERKIGIRIPNYPLTLEILKKKGPLRATSVNLSGQKPLNNYQEIVDRYKNLVDYIYPYDKNYKLSQKASTVLDTTMPIWKILRKGSISSEMIKKIIGDF
ncbi:L-threonylcarbamoyladenylate synthase [Candidatus Phytoplasma pini]|uniref:L-threonylcarbamoyladenylate synthase n=1 Tax=Candidatus Phytoplasma pini TaxID=267362 RepID=A0A559KJ53_9MOLU|nr:L-threonylcarbamoyladenylate synthase [Candidatus Phytoplasma pini]TVY12154.1 Translation factor SUA5 [Candidatus Phytoplasma pini]